MKHSFLLCANLIFTGLISQAANANANVPARLIWSDDKGFVSGTSCVAQTVDDVAFRVSEKPRHTRLLARVKPGSAQQPLIESMSDYVLTAIRNSDHKSIPKTSYRLAATFWQASMNGERFNVLKCGSNQNPYLLFDVFAPGVANPVIQVGVNSREIDIFENMRIDSIEEAKEELSEIGHNKIDPMLSRDMESQEAAPAEVSPTATAASTSSTAPTVTTVAKIQPGHTGELQFTGKPGENSTNSSGSSGAEDQSQTKIDMVICLNEGHLQVRDQKLTNVLFEASDLDRVQVLTKSGEQKPELKVDDAKYTFIKVKFVDHDENESVGYVAEKFVLPKAQCRATPAPPAAKPVTVTPIATPAPEAKPTLKLTPQIDILAPNCAEKIILKAAKESVAEEWNNRSTSGGLCALGVRHSLQRSKVGNVTDGLGNAVDYINRLKEHGFVDSGLKDIKKAPAGAILIFRGPNTDAYFRNGNFGHPPGNWLGHVTIKGGDGYYYTDARTREPAIGWSGGKNVSHVRNLLAIFVPGRALIQQYANSCPAK